MQLFLVRHGLILFLQVAFARRQHLLQLVPDLLDFTGALLIQVDVVALKGIHLTLQPRLLLPLDHAPLLILDHVALRGRLELLLLLMQIFLRLVEVAAQ